MIVTKIEFRYSSSDDFQPIVFTQNSASFSESSSETKHGTLYTSDANAYCSGITPEKTALFDMFCRKRPQFAITDNDGGVHLLGSDDNRAVFSYTKINSGTPGSKFGYQIRISYKSPMPAVRQVL